MQQLDYRKSMRTAQISSPVASLRASPLLCCCGVKLLPARRSELCRSNGRLHLVISVGSRTRTLPEPTFMLLPIRFVRHSEDAPKRASLLCGIYI